MSVLYKRLTHYNNASIMVFSLNSQLNFIQYIESNYFRESKSVLLCTIIYAYLWSSSCLRLRSYGYNSKNTTEAINTSDLNIILYNDASRVAINS